MKEASLRMAKESFRIEAKAVLDALDAMDDAAFGRAVDALCTAERIVTTGCGHSGIAARKFAHSLCCVERPGKFMSPAEAVHGGMGGIRAGDVLVWASRGGKTSELVNIVRVCREKKAVIIGVTENLDSPLARQSDIVLPMKIEKESDRYNVMATSSFVGLVALFDALHIAIMEETGYRLEQFALIHPGGAVGERLN